MTDAIAERRFLVTGGAGFLGAYLVERLRARGAIVFVPRSCDYDLVDRDAVLRVLADARPEVVIHLASRVGGIGANRKNPARFFYENLMMGAQVIHESWAAGVQRVIAAGTICAYPKFARAPFREDEIWEGYPEETNAPYGLAKKMLLVQSEAYRAQYQFNSTVLFPVNLYGPRDNFNPETSHVIPALIRKIGEAQKASAGEVQLWGDGTPTREFLFVEDAADGFIAAVEKGDLPQPINLGSGREISIRALAELLAQLMGFAGRFVFDPSQPNGQPRRVLDVSRARAQLGWWARTPLEDGLRRTIEWWRSQP